MSNGTSPFVPGARVAVETGRGSYREDRVLKVHKNGNFTLASNPAQQWRPSPSRDRWAAWQTGEHSHWSRSNAYFWAEDDAQLTAKIEAAKLVDRARDLVFRLSHIDPRRITAAGVDFLECALKEIGA